MAVLLLMTADRVATDRQSQSSSSSTGCSANERARSERLGQMRPMTRMLFFVLMLVPRLSGSAPPPRASPPVQTQASFLMTLGPELQRARLAGDGARYGVLTANLASVLEDARTTTAADAPPKPHLYSTIARLAGDALRARDLTLLSAMVQELEYEGDTALRALLEVCGRERGGDTAWR